MVAELVQSHQLGLDCALLLIDSVTLDNSFFLSLHSYKMGIRIEFACRVVVKSNEKMFRKAQT